MQFFADHKMSWDDAIEIINGFTSENYCKGPVDDQDYPGDKVWIFGFVYSGKEIYVKLADNTTRKAKVISFHDAKYDLHYPFKRDAGNRNSEATGNQ